MLNFRWNYFYSQKVCHESWSNKSRKIKVNFIARQTQQLTLALIPVEQCINLAKRL